MEVDVGLVSAHPLAQCRDLVAERRRVTHTGLFAEHLTEEGEIGPR